MNISRYGSTYKMESESEVSHKVQCELCEDHHMITSSVLVVHQRLPCLEFGFAHAHCSWDVFIFQKMIFVLD